jgi:hypothetical protein
MPPRPEPMPGRAGPRLVPDRLIARGRRRFPPGRQVRRAGLNENYARELMSCYPRRRGRLHMEGREVARAFTATTI